MLGRKYLFCPGKATWDEEIAELFQVCRTAMESGIMPDEGSFQDQDEIFVEVFPYFVEQWKESNYQKIWDDVRAHTEVVLKSVFGKK